MPINVNFRMSEDATDLCPVKAHPDDAAFDLFSRQVVTLPPGSVALIHTGLFLEIMKLAKDPSFLIFLSKK